MSATSDIKRLYLLDAYALIYRAHFAFIRNPLVNSKGMNVSAITGFVNTINDLLTKEAHKPTHLAVCFDVHGPTERELEYAEYKANREEMPEDIRASIPYIRQILEGFRIPILEKEGFEADDVIGTLAKRAVKDDFEVYMVTPDKDYGQLVEDKIFMYKPSTRGKPREILGVAEILKRWEIEKVDQVIDILGLMGDAVDNIPGVKGVGEKTAIKLLKQFGSIENMLENTDQIKGKLREKVENDREMALLSKKLATIICDVDVPYEPEEYVLSELDVPKLTSIFQELEFRTLGQRILGEGYTLNAKTVGTKKKKKTGQLSLFGEQPNQNNAALLEEVETEKGQNIENTEHDYQLVDTVEGQEKLVQQLLAQELVCFDSETTSVDANNAELVGLSFAWEAGKAYYVPLAADQEKCKATLELFRPFFESDKVAKVGQNIKYDMLVLKWYDMEVKGTLHDTMLAHYLIEPNMRHNMDLMAETYLHYTPVSIVSLIGKKGKKQLSMRQVPVEKVTEYAGEDADITLQLHHKFAPTVGKEEITKLYSDMEMPLVRVLTDMEYEGINLDKEFLENYSEELGKDILSLEEGVYEAVGKRFNLKSPSQLGDILFGELEIPYKGKKTKTGKYSTNEETLKKIAASGQYPIMDQILDFRELTKLKSTYVDTLPQLLNPKTGRIHTTFNQAIAATGRLSSADPNLQNIPIRTEKGRMVRKAFIPRNEDFILMAADYSQVELRLMAELSQDKAMLDAFQNGIDIHSATAARVNGVELGAVSPEMRRKAKTVNFGIIYGITAFGLSQRIGISRTEAKEIIEEYFKQYTGIKKYMDEIVEKTRKTGYAETILGRRRYLKDINSSNNTVRGFAERNAINTPIQGSAADLIKLAMINVHKEMNKRQLKSKMLLQVHDELVFDVHRSELEEMEVLVKDLMSNAMPSLKVPLEVEADTGMNWLEAH